jgi:hypothetical protein
MKRYGVLLVIMQGCSLFCAEEEFEVIESEPLSVSIQELISARVQELVKVMNATMNYAMWREGKKLRSEKLHALGLSGEQSLLQTETPEAISDNDFEVLKKSFVAMRERVARNLWADIRDTEEEPSQRGMFSMLGVATPSATLQYSYTKLRELYEKAMKDEAWARKQADEASFFSNELGPVMQQIAIRFLYDIDVLRNKFAELYDIQQSKGSAWNPADASKKIWDDVLAAVLHQYDDFCIKRCFGLLKRLIEVYDGVTIRAMWSNMKDRGGISRQMPNSIPWTINLMRKNIGVIGGVSLSGSLDSTLQQSFERFEKELVEAYYKRVPQETKTYAQQQQQELATPTSLISAEDQKEVQGYIGDFVEKVHKDSSVAAINKAGDELRTKLVAHLKKYKALFHPGRMVKRVGTFALNPTAKTSEGERFEYPEYDILPPDVVKAWGEFIGISINRRFPVGIIGSKTRLIIRQQLHPDKLGSLVNFDSDADLTSIFDEAFKIVT